MIVLSVLTLQAKYIQAINFNMFQILFTAAYRMEMK